MTSRRLPAESPPKTGGRPITDPAEHQPQAHIAHAQNAVQAQIRVVGDHRSFAVGFDRDPVDRGEHEAAGHHEEVVCAVSVVSSPGDPCVIIGTGVLHQHRAEAVFANPELREQLSCLAGVDNLAVEGAGAKA